MKEIKDYVNLFGIGCPISTIDGEGKIMTIHAKGVTVSLRKISLNQELHGFDKGKGGLHRTYLFKDNFCKLILRPLSDMTDDEISTQDKIIFKGYNLLVDSGETCKYLLSHHFDIFNLIPEGLAIDATTLVNQLNNK